MFLTNQNAEIVACILLYQIFQETNLISFSLGTLQLRGTYLMQKYESEL